MQIAMSPQAPQRNFAEIQSEKSTGDPSLMGVSEFKKVLEKPNSKQNLENSKLVKREKSNDDTQKNTETQLKNPNTEKAKQNLAKTRDSKVIPVKSSGVKSRAVQKFMASLESELGISAERFSAVLERLPNSVKSMSLEESAPFIIEELGIPPALQESAQANYKSLLDQSGLGKSLENSGTSFSELALNMDNLSGIENQSMIKGNSLKHQNKIAERAKLNQALDEMNRRFFEINSVEPSKVVSTNPLVDQQTQGEINPLLENLESTTNEVIQSNNLGPANKSIQSLIPSDRRSTMIEGEYSHDEMSSGEEPLKNEMGEYFVENQNQPRNLREMLESKINRPLDFKSEMNSAQETVNAKQVINPNYNDLQSVEFEQNLPQIKNPILQNVPLRSQKSWSVEELPFLTGNDGSSWGPLENSSSGTVSPNSLSSFNDQGSMNQGDESNSLFMNKGELTGLKDSRSKKTEMSEDSFQNSFFPMDNSQSKVEDSKMGSSANAPTASGVNQQDKINNINRISSATEALAARGGGEMKVMLTPEGMGTIELKVKMLEGKLHVEMKADNRESQKLLESGIGDLRQALTSHRLSVDTVKVDVGTDSARQDNSQSFAQQTFDQGRDQARNFMNQFREGNFSQRQTFFDAPGFKTYKTQSSDSLAPISQEVRPRSLLSEGKGSEINLVA